VNVLVIAPHPDDEAIGCGGAVLSHSKRGDRVSVAFLTSGELGLKSLSAAEARRVREEEALAASRLLKTSPPAFLHLADWGLEDAVAEAGGALRPVIASVAPQLIYLPHPADDHPDHRACLPIVQAALSAAGGPAPQLRGYEIWSPMAAWDLAEDITAVMNEKLAAIGIYKSQLDQARYDRAIAGLNQYRGALAGRCDFAEAFALLEP
jgi:LmbE family N-acetylglucosaminyl deacetylase